MDATPNEIWKPVVGWEGLYQVSDMGRVKSLARTRRSRGNSTARVKERMLALPTDTHGYAVVLLCKDGNRVQRKVHHLVLEAFVGPRPDELLTRHLDGNPANNRLDNIAYGTPSENSRDAIAHGTHHEAKKTHCPQGHEYDDATTKFTAKGHRLCRKCSRIRSSARAAEAKAERARRRVTPTHCKHGHEFTLENTYWVHQGRVRACRECQRQYLRAYKARKRNQEVR